MPHFDCLVGEHAVRAAAVGHHLTVGGDLVQDPDEFAERLRVLATIARLVMLPEVRIKEPFLIMSLDLGVPTGSTAN